jgi:hypothetical protein
MKMIGGSRHGEEVPNFITPDRIHFIMPTVADANRTERYVRQQWYHATTGTCEIFYARDGMHPDAITQVAYPLLSRDARFKS